LARRAERYALADLEDAGITGRAAAQAEAGRAMASTARLRGFGRVENLADELTDIAARGTLESSLKILLDGIGSRSGHAAEGSHPDIG
jgi:hypothetical protein